MKLISTVTKLKTDLSESRARSNLMEDFPPICKKDPVEVRIHFIKDHYETYGKVIRLDDVPDEMYGGALPIARSRKSKRKMTSKEEYIEAKQPAKKAKKGNAASEKLKIGGSDMPSIEEEIEDLDTDVVQSKKARSGKAAASTQAASELPSVPKRKRKFVMRKIKESPYVVEEVEDVKTSTNLITRELKKKKKKDEDAAALQKALETAQEIEIPATSLVRVDVAADAEEVVNAA
jgi:hypothetical protein